MAHVLGHGRPRVEAAFGAPATQNRRTVALRLILVVPHVVVLAALGLAAGVVVVLGWFSILFTGEMPAGFTVFLSSYLEYSARVSAYASLMHDAYPPFGFDRSYVVSLGIETGPVWRVAVLFRLFLVLPMAVVAGVASVGVGVSWVVVWLVVLIVGAMPPALFDAIAAVIRFHARVSAYACMLTSKYPGELFGDTRVSGSPPVVPAPAARSAPWAADALTAEGPDGTTGGVAARASTTAALSSASPLTSPVAWSPPPMPGAAPLVLAPRARRILLAFVLVGSVAYGTYVAVVIAGTGSSKADANASLTQAHSQLADTLSTIEQRQASCAKTNLACVQRGDGNLASAFARFGATERSLTFPESERAAAARLQEHTRTLVALLDRLSADTLAQYTTDETSLENDAAAVDAAYQAWFDTTR